MSIIHSSLLLGAGAAAGGYQIERSLRFNSSDSAYLSKAFGSPTSSVAWTWASWVKKTLITTSTDYRGIFECGAGSNYAYLDFSDNSIRYVNRPTTGTIAVLQTTPVYRDASAWFHMVFAYDSANGTSTDRLRLYVNGTRVTIFSSSTYPDPSQASVFNSAVDHRIGRDAGNNGYFDGYLADIHFIDGQALTPSSFTEVSATTGQLIPKAYTGTFTGNSFWLKFSDNSSTTSGSNVGIGKDFSGLGNYWNSTNLSVTAGAGNDSLVDTPTSYGTGNSGGDVRGNFCTWNPLQSSAATLTNGNLDCTTAVATGAQTRGTIAVSTGKWYWEILVNTTVSANNIGIIKTSEALAADRPSYYAGGYCYVGSSGNKENNASASSYGATYGSGDVIGVALDLDAGTLVFYKNGTSQGTAFSSLSGEFIPAIGDGTGGSGMDISANFGQRPFAHPAPSGFKALCDTNLISTTITTSGSYTGNGVADGPFVYLNGVPTAMTIGGNAVTFGTHADKLSNGFKIRTSSTTYNQNASSYSYSITSTGAAFKNARAQPNP